MIDVPYRHALKNSKSARKRIRNRTRITRPQIESIVPRLRATEALVLFNLYVRASTRSVRLKRTHGYRPF